MRVRSSRPDVAPEAEGTHRQLEEAGKSTMRFGAILFLMGAGMTALTSLTIASQSQTRGIASTVFLIAL